MYEANNHLMICAEYADPEQHQHSAAHIMLSLNGRMEVMVSDEAITCEGILIPSGISHTANSHGEQVLVFLFDSTTAVSRQIESVKVIPESAVSAIRKAFIEFESGEPSAARYDAFIQCVYSCVAINDSGTVISDERIKRALTFIKSKLHSSITCSDAAQHVFLSEGRFSHLFRDQVGMTFAAYLIYQRIIKAYTDIINGCSVTAAAMNAGFSSSAHFAEVNKRIFGLPATGIKKNLKFYKIAEI